MADMTGFINLLALGANAIITLEAQNTTCADVFYAWVCIAYDLEQVLSKVMMGVGKHHPEVIRIFNFQFTQMMDESSHKLFLLGYYLHPCKLKLFTFSLRGLINTFQCFGITGDCNWLCLSWQMVKNWNQTNTQRSSGLFFSLSFKSFKESNADFKIPDVRWFRT